MRKFSVMFERRITECLEFKIEAKDWDEAREIAASMAMAEDAEWERDDWDGEFTRSFCG